MYIAFCLNKKESTCFSVIDAGKKVKEEEE